MTHTDSADAVRCTPVPDWVDHEPYASPPPQPDDASVSNGVGLLLCDNQIDLAGPEFGWHCRTAQRVATRAGSERIAQFGVEFDPAFQRLEVHFVRVLRGAERIEHASPGAFQMLRRETTLERLTLNGRLTATLVIPDLRVDDVLEIAITLYGSNAALQGKYAGWMTFDAFTPWLETRHRMVRPLTREISIKQFNEPPVATVAVQNAVEVSRWHIVGQKRREFEVSRPPWFLSAPTMQLTEFRNWSEVARLFTASYESPDVPETLASEIDRLAAAYQDPAERAAEWLRFVQKNLRYFAIVPGEGALIPRELPAIWAGRFGDCKDAARLYVAGARRLGLDACAALVSTTHGPALDDFLPSPAVFNHCIVRLRRNGASYWLDPTLQMQSGSLANIDQPHAGWALPLTADTTALESLGSKEPLHVLNCVDDISFGPKRQSPVTLRRTTETRYWVADAVRNRIANEGTVEYLKRVQKDLELVWPNVVATAPLQITDDPVTNHLVVTTSFEIRDGWTPANNKQGLTFSVADQVIAGQLNQIGGNARHADIYLGRPRKVTSSVVIEMPRRWSGKATDWQFREQGVAYRARFSVRGRIIRNEKELTIKAWSMPAGEAAAYRAVVDRMRQGSLVLRARELFGRIFPAGLLPKIAIYVLFYGAIIIYWLWALPIKVVPPH
jgi:hypothetical protein